VTGQLGVVLGRFRDLPGFEASGVVGAGDNLALRELSDYFTRIGFRRFTVYYNDQFDAAALEAPSPLQENLVLLGGPDANSVTREVLTRLDLGIEFLEVSRPMLNKLRGGRGDHAPRLWNRAAPHRRAAREWRVPVIRDRTDGRLHGPILDGDAIRGDCGIVIRCGNPFNETREVVILCGSYGYGTWGAVRFLQSSDFLRGLPRRVRAFECLLSVDITGERPQGVRVVLFRPLVDYLAVGSVTVPRIIE
jgi:hypothetical protein